MGEICRNMGICCGFRAEAARGKYPGGILLVGGTAYLIGKYQNVGYIKSTAVCVDFFALCTQGTIIFQMLQTASLHSPRGILKSLWNSIYRMEGMAEISKLCQLVQIISDPM